MTEAAALRARAEAAAGPLPPLLAQADHLAATVLLGSHGRRRAGAGDDFWQYRPLRAGDDRRMIDWRRSARGDEQFVREREWQIAQSVLLWSDASASMRFASDAGLPQKAERARLLAMAAALLLLRGGERVGLATGALPPRRGEGQATRLAQELLEEGVEDYAAPRLGALGAGGRGLLLSDFMGPLAPLEEALGRAADRGVRGALVQILDPVEEAFPFRGRTIFESVGGALRHETLKARDLRARYLDRLAERRAALEALCAATGWQLGLHRTDRPAQAGLLWIWHALDARSA